MAQFRLRFDADTRATWTGFADTLYTLFCNGEPVGVGPVLSHHLHPYETTWDLSPHLRHGQNELLLEVWFEGRRNDCCDAEPIQGGVIGLLESDREIIGTGPRWQARPLPGYRMPGPDGWRLFASHRLIIADLREQPPAWATACVLAPHPDRGELSPAPIPSLTCVSISVRTVIDAGVARDPEPMPVVLAEDVAKRLAAQQHESRLRPASKLPPIFDRPDKMVYGLPVVCPWPLEAPAVDGDYYFTLDCGKQASGCVLLEVETEGEVTLDVAYGDSLALEGRVNPRAQEHSLADRVILPPGRRQVRLPHDRGFRYLQLSCSAPAKIHRVEIEEHLFHYGEPMTFRCSDDTLNAIWDICMATLRQCSLTTLVDNSTRERQGWGGPDMFASNHGTMYGFGDTRLVAKKFDDFCNFFDQAGHIPCWAPGHGGWVKVIPSHDLWFPANAWQYVLFSDDRARAERLLHVSESVLRAYDVSKPTGGWKWAEWNLNTAEAVCTWEVLLAIQGWRAVEKLRTYCGVVGDTPPDYSDLLERLWHPAHQALAQGTRADGATLDFCGQVDNALALLLDVLPADKAAAAYRFCAGRSGTWPTNRSGWQGDTLGERVRHDPRKPVVAGSPVASVICAEAMFAAGMAGEAVQYLRYNFGAMLDEGEGGAWECWPVAIAAQAAVCRSQGWGALLLATFIQHLLGVRFIKPGGTELTFQPPRDTGLEWVEGTVRTQCGLATFRWDADGMHADLPKGVSEGSKS